MTNGFISSTGDSVPDTARGYIYEYMLTMITMLSQKEVDDDTKAMNGSFRL